MKYKKTIITLSLVAVSLFAVVSAQVKEKEFMPTVLPELTATTTDSIYKFDFDIKTIKKIPERQAVEYQPAVYSITTNELITEEIPAVEYKPITYEERDITHTKTFSKLEWNYCRSIKTEAECYADVKQAIADSKAYHLSVEKERYKQIMLEKNLTDYQLNKNNL